MESLLEVLRSYHEEREKIEDTIVQELVCKKFSKKNEIYSGHLIRELLERHKTISLQVLEMYLDRDGALKKEINSLCGSNEFAEFYGKLRLIKEHHRKFHTEGVTSGLNEYQRYQELRENEIDENMISTNFTDEESFGRYIDLHELYSHFLNLFEGKKKMTYLEYLGSFEYLCGIPQSIRLCKKYRENYLNHMLNYLVDFIGRAMPLLNIDAELSKADKTFEKLVENDSVIGWTFPDENGYFPTDSDKRETKSDTKINLDNFRSWKNLCKLGLEELKNQLTLYGVKCGGSLNERAQRLFSLKGKSEEEIDPSLKQKVNRKRKCKKSLTLAPTKEQILEIAKKETRVYHLVGIVNHIRNETIENVERKQSRTIEELLTEEQEAAEQIHIGGGDDDEEENNTDTTIYNPKNLPLDIDGKPIPYWLYKLHGLNMYYDCEICGNCKYRGPKAFQRHFAEWRHSHGLRCLGITNSPDFMNVTGIDDALKLWEKLKSDKINEKWDPEIEEEFEDSAGNVINKKVYEDLRKQGLL